MYKEAVITIIDKRGIALSEFSAQVDNTGDSISMRLPATSDILRDIWFSDDYSVYLSIRYLAGKTSAMQVIMNDFSESYGETRVLFSLVPAEVLKEIYA